MHHQVHFPVHGNDQFAGHDVVPGFHFVRGIQAEIVLIALVDFVRMNRAELSVWAGIPEIERKLFSLGLYLQRIGLGGHEVHRGPGLLTEGTQCKNFRADDKERRNHHGLGATWKILQRSVRFAARESKEEVGEYKLGANKCDACFEHGVMKLAVDQMAMSRDVHRKRKIICDDWIGGKHRHQYKYDGKKLPHKSSPSRKLCAVPTVKL